MHLVIPVFSLSSPNDSHNVLDDRLSIDSRTIPGSFQVLTNRIKVTYIPTEIQMIDQKYEKIKKF